MTASLKIQRTDGFRLSLDFEGPVELAAALAQLALRYDLDARSPHGGANVGIVQNSVAADVSGHHAASRVPETPSARLDADERRRARNAAKARRYRERRVERASGRVTTATGEGDGGGDASPSMVTGVTLGGDGHGDGGGDASPSRVSLSSSIGEKEDVSDQKNSEDSSTLRPSSLPPERRAREAVTGDVTPRVTPGDVTGYASPATVTAGDGPRVPLVDDLGERPFPAPLPASLPPPGSPPPAFVATVADEVAMSEGVAIDGASSWRTFLDHAHTRRAEGKRAFATEAHFRSWARDDARRALAARVSGTTWGPRRVVQQDPPGPKAYQQATADDPWDDEGGSVPPAPPAYPPRCEPPEWAKAAADELYRRRGHRVDVATQWDKFTAHAAKRTHPIEAENAWHEAWGTWIRSPLSTAKRSPGAIVQGGPRAPNLLPSWEDDDEPSPGPASAPEGHEPCATGTGP